MITNARILAASVFAPFLVTVPLYVLSYVSWSFLRVVMPSMRQFGASLVAGRTALSVHLGVAVATSVVAIVLRAGNVLSRGSLLLASAVVACVAGVWLSCDWETSCQTSEAIPNFVIYSLIAFLILAGISLAWWRLAMLPFRAALPSNGEA